MLKKLKVPHTLVLLYGMVVLASGFCEQDGTRALAEAFGVELGEGGFAAGPEFAPCETNVPGIFTAGAFREPKDIPESTGEAACAANLAAQVLSAPATAGEIPMAPTPADFRGEEPAIGVFLCTCEGFNEKQAQFSDLEAAVENMPDGQATRPGDIVTSLSGQTVEILNTDAEGRLILCDALTYAEKFDPDVVIDVATLTGSVGRAVGPYYAGVFSLDDDLADSLVEAGAATGEELWQLPLNDTYFEQIKSDVADVKNGGAGGAGASVGAAFIGSFVGEGQAWAHIDIAGVDYTEEPQPTAPKGFTGWGVRLLDEYLRRHYE